MLHRPQPLGEQQACAPFAPSCSTTSSHQRRARAGRCPACKRRGSLRMPERCPSPRTAPRTRPLRCHTCKRVHHSGAQAAAAAHENVIQVLPLQKPFKSLVINVEQNDIGNSVWTAHEREGCDLCSVVPRSFVPHVARVRHVEHALPPVNARGPIVRVGKIQ